MADYQSDRTGANIDQVLDNADAGNIGKDSTAPISDLDSSGISLITSYGSSATGAPNINSGVMVQAMGLNNTRSLQLATDLAGTDFSLYGRKEFNSAFGTWREIYHDNGNGVTAAEAATAIKGAKDGGIGLTGIPLNTIDFDNQPLNAIGGANDITIDGISPADGTIVSATRNQVDGFQLWNLKGSSKISVRTQASGVWSELQELYHDNGNGVTAAQAATAIKGAKDGNIGKESPSVLTDNNYDNITNFGVQRNNNAAPALNYPFGNATDVAPVLSVPFTSTYGGQLSFHANLKPKAAFRTQYGAGFSAWQELYHTGNTGNAVFDSAISSGDRTVAIGQGKSISSTLNCQSSGDITADFRHWQFQNPNGVVGSIVSNGTATAYNTSSDNRLKDPIGKPTDADIDAKFNDIYDTFTLFNWKNNPDGDAVWGFLAHDVIDKGLDFGSEGEGPRSLNIGDVYETIPAETEERPVMETVTDEDGNEIEQQATDEQGNLLFEEVVVKEAIEKRVTPAGVDQSKITAYLVPFAELQRRRIDELESQLAALTQRLDAAGL